MVKFKGQLWCYRWIDDWALAKSITLVAEIWFLPDGNEYYDLNNCDVIKFSWSKDRFNKEIEEFFTAYGGIFTK